MPINRVIVDNPSTGQTEVLSHEDFIDNLDSFKTVEQLNQEAQQKLHQEIINGSANQS